MEDISNSANNKNLKIINKKNDVLTHSIMWINLYNIMLN